MNRTVTKKVEKFTLNGFPNSSAQSQMVSPSINSNVSPKYSDQVKEINFAKGLTLQKIQAPKNLNK